MALLVHSTEVESRPFSCCFMPISPHYLQQNVWFRGLATAKQCFVHAPVCTESARSQLTNTAAFSRQTRRSEENQAAYAHAYAYALTWSTAVRDCSWVIIVPRIMPKFGRYYSTAQDAMFLAQWQLAALVETGSQIAPAYVRFQCSSAPCKEVCRKHIPSGFKKPDGTNPA